MSAQGGGLVLSFATHQPPRSAVRDLAGVIASSPMILQTNPAARPVVWLGGMASMILPNQLIPVPLDINVSKPLSSLFCTDELTCDYRIYLMTRSATSNTQRTQ